MSRTSVRIFKKSDITVTKHSTSTQIWKSGPVKHDNRTSNKNDQVPNPCRLAPEHMKKNETKWCFDAECICLYMIFSKVSLKNAV